MQFESIHHGKSGSPVKSDSGLVARRDHHVGGVLSPLADFGEKLRYEEGSGPRPRAA
jgi:hypothetical protein